jgi:hypothetical protein
MIKFIHWFFGFALLVAPAGNGAVQKKTANLVLVTLDGARNQEIFGGLDLEILRSVTEKRRAEDTELYKKYWAATPQARREKTMPFFWGTLMKHHGSIAGNRDLGSTVQVTNKHRFSYPGYSEILTGQAHDDVIDSNDKRRNPYPTVLEFLKHKLGLEAHKVAAFTSWDTLDWIVEHEEGSISSNAGFEPYVHPHPVIQELSKLQFETVTPWDSVRHDVYTFRFAKAHLETFKPRILYLGLGETDDWAHDRRYDRVLGALVRTDNFLKELWEFLQSQDQYRDKTTLLITVDHGRGSTPADWTKHGKEVEEAQYIWLAVVSPDSDLRREWTNTPTIYQNQVAATLCRFLGLDYSENNPLAGKPIARLFTE